MNVNMNHFMEGIAARMRELMDGETQVTLAAKLQVSQGNVAKYLQGKIVPRSDVLLHMLLSKNVNPAWFLTGKGQKFLGKGYSVSKGGAPISKTSQVTKIPYGVSKELRRIENKVQKLAYEAPDSLKQVRVFLSAVQQSFPAKGKRKKSR